jgi:hypothetical protein
VSREVLQAGSGIRRALIKNMAAGNIFQSSIESGFKMAISSGQSGLHVKLMMDPCSIILNVISFSLQDFMKNLPMALGKVA